MARRYEPVIGLDDRIFGNTEFSGGFAYGKQPAQPCAHRREFLSQRITTDAASVRRASRIHSQGSPCPPSGTVSDNFLKLYLLVNEQTD